MKTYFIIFAIYTMLVYSLTEQQLCFGRLEFAHNFLHYLLCLLKNFRQMHYCINWANSSYQFYQLFLNLKKNCLFGFVQAEKKLIVYVVSLCKLVCYVARWSTNLSSRISALAVSLHGLRRWRRCLAR